MFSTLSSNPKIHQIYPNFTDCSLRSFFLGWAARVSFQSRWWRRGKSSALVIHWIYPATQHASGKIQVWSTTVTRKIGNYILVWARVNVSIFVWQIGIRVCVYVQTRECMFSFTGICKLYLCSYAVNTVCLLLHTCIMRNIGWLNLFVLKTRQILWAAWVL